MLHSPILAASSNLPSENNEPDNELEKLANSDTYYLCINELDQILFNLLNLEQEVNRIAGDGLIL